MHLPEIVTSVAGDPLCEVRRRERPLALDDRGWPADWRHLVENLEKFEIFTRRAGTEYSGNSWALGLGEVPIVLNEFTFDVRPPELDPFFGRCIVIAHNRRDGADIIGLNLNPGPGFGKIFFAWMAKALGYRCPIIADSVTEWIDLTYRAGYDSGYYFLKDGFVDRGPLIPNDPEYTGVRSIFDP